MTLRIKNIEYFKWEVGSELQELAEKERWSLQDLIDRYFDPDHLSVDRASDTYYELEGETT